MPELRAVAAAAPSVGVVQDAAPVWKSTSESGVRAVKNLHPHAIEQASRRWRGGRRDDSARTRRKIMISAQVFIMHITPWIS